MLAGIEVSFHLFITSNLDVCLSVHLHAVATLHPVPFEWETGRVLNCLDALALYTGCTLSAVR